MSKDKVTLKFKITSLHTVFLYSNVRLLVKASFRDWFLLHAKLETISLSWNYVISDPPLYLLAVPVELVTVKGI